MKFSLKMLLAGFVVISVAAGCSKDESNPTDPNNGGGNNTNTFKKENLYTTWAFGKGTVNGQVNSGLKYNDKFITFTNDGKYSVPITSTYNEEGTWTLTSDNKYLVKQWTNPIAGGPPAPDTLQIVKSTADTLHIKNVNQLSVKEEYVLVRGAIGAVAAAKINGRQWLATYSDAYSNSQGNFISLKNELTGEHITLKVAKFETGSYIVRETGNDAAYELSGQYSQGSETTGTTTITSANGTKVSGTFSFTTKMQNDPTKTIVVTDGRFTAE
jgi:hypothetical protein